MTSDRPSDVAAGAPAPVAPGWAEFPGSGVYPMGKMARFTGFALVSLLLAGPVYAWPLVFDGRSTPSAAAVYLGVTLALLCAAAALVRYVTHARFALQPHSIDVRRLGGGVSLPLARIEAMTVTRRPRSSSYTVRLHGTGSDRSLTIHPDVRHLRDERLFAWLVAIPRRGGIAIARPVPASTALAFGTSVAAGIFTLALMALMASGPIDLARHLLTGYPPLESLSEVEGTLASVGRCHPGGKNFPAWVPITVATAGGPAAESVDCDIGSALRAGGDGRPVSIRRDKRMFADGQVREVDLDGRVLKSYAEYVARSRRVAPFELLGALMLMSALGSMSLRFVLSSREA